MTSEAQLSIVVLRLLSASPSGTMLYEDLIAAIPSHITLTHADLRPSPTRPGEAIWEQRVRNITSHQGNAGNIIERGLAVPIPSGLEITPAGRKAAQH